ncbi:MAG: YkgJ family cysteine cluster protein [Sphingomicrobium sp.]
MVPSDPPAEEKPLDDRLRGTELCTSCGLCCTGALHDTAKLDPDEVPAAQAMGLPVAPTGKPCFSLPCPKLQGTLCGIYGERPRVCGRYRCGLLQRLEAGETAFIDAQSKVAAAYGLIGRLREFMAPGMSLPEARAMALKDAEGLRPSDMPLRLAATAMVLYIDRNFRNEREGRLVRLEPVGTAREMERDDEAAVQKI